MKISEHVQNSLLLVTNSAVTDKIYKDLLENCFVFLTGGPEPHNMNGLYNSKPDVIKELYAALLSVIAEFVRSNEPLEDIARFLSTECSFSPARLTLFSEFYNRYRQEVEVALVNIGCHSAHITDVTSKIDYMVMSSGSDEMDGPLFRIGLQTEEFNAESGAKRVDFVNFTCTSQELQDLVYKLKDAVRHCHRLISDH